MPVHVNVVLNVEFMWDDDVSELGITVSPEYSFRIRLVVYDPQRRRDNSAGNVRTAHHDKGIQSPLATRRALQRVTAADGFDMVEYISNLRKSHWQVELMENKMLVTAG